MSRKKCGYSTTDLEALDIARGLYDSKINIKRPPSGAQHEVYSATCRGPPIQSVRGRIKPRPFSAKGRITTEKLGTKTVSPLAVKPPWRPFSGHAALTRPNPSPAAKENRIGDIAVLEGGANDSQKIPCVPTVYQDRQLPKGVSSLREWLTEDVPTDWADGYSPTSSFVFLPCVQSGECQPENLPCVPSVQLPDDWLIYYPPVPEVKKYKPSKSRFRQFLEDDSINATHSDSVDGCAKPNLTGGLHHDVYEGVQRADIIRQEIEDLERLLQGIGNPKGSSIVVRYQHDINTLKDMVKTTLEGYEFPEEARCRTPVAVSLQEDLVRYPERHGKIMASIKERRDQCVKELADIEREIMSTEEKHVEC